MATVHPIVKNDNGGILESPAGFFNFLSKPCSHNFFYYCRLVLSTIYHHLLLTRRLLDMDNLASLMTNMGTPRMAAMLANTHQLFIIILRDITEFSFNDISTNTECCCG